MRRVAAADTPEADWLGWAAAGLANPLLDLRAAEEAVAVLRARACRRRAQPGARADLPLPRSALFGDADDGRRAPRRDALAERAQQIAEQVTTPPGKVDFWGEQAYCAIAETQLAAGEIERAEKTMQDRLQAWERSGSAQRSIAMTTRLLSRCAEARGDWATAARMLARSAEAAGDRGPALRALADRSRACPRSHRGGQARGGRGSQARARELIDTMAASVGEEQIAARFRERALAEIDHPGPTLGH